MRMPSVPEYFLDRLATGSITPEEWKQLQALLNEQGNDPLFAAIIEEQLKQRAAEPAAYPQAVKHIQDGVTARIAQERLTAAPVVKPMYARRRNWLAAAAVLLIAGAAWWLLPQQADKPAPATAKKSAIMPGQSGAVLTLADGSKVLLDTIKSGVVALQGGVAARVVNGALVYEGKGASQVYNTITTPKGREYHITLPDSTEVWLNAASSIRYPLAFAATERRVEMKGEAYLEVTTEARKPFIVVTPLSQIQVLGTAFNINAYEEEGAEITTLATGKIRVTGNAPLNGKATPVTLLPGQAASCTGNELVVQPGNVEKAIAWKNGIFNFNDADLPTVMRQLARWYNVDIKYEGAVPARTFEGEMGRTLSLDQVLSILTKTRIHYEIEGNTLTIKP